MALVSKAVHPKMRKVRPPAAVMVNGVSLDDAQVKMLKVLLTWFRRDLQGNGLRSSSVGLVIADHLDKKAAEVQELLNDK